MVGPKKLDFCISDLKDFFWFFEMEELGASEAHKTEVLNYKVLNIYKANDNLL